MKHDRLQTGLPAFLLAVGAAAGGAGCLVTAFHLAVEHPLRLMGVWMAAAAVCAWVFCRRRSGLGIACLWSAGMGYLLSRPVPWGQCLALVQRIGGFYSLTYPPEIAREPADWPLGILGSTTAVLVSRTVCRRRGGWLGIGMAALPLMLCLGVTDAVPRPGPLMLLLTVLGLLLIADSVRRESAAQGSRLMLRAAVPTVLVTSILFALIPQDSYVNRSEELRSSILAMAEHLPKPVPIRMIRLEETVDLAALTPHQKQTDRVLQLTSRRGGRIYLRGRSYTVYTGTGWLTGAGQTAVGSTGSPADHITVRTRGIHDCLYLPYDPPAGTVLTNGMAANTQGWQEYSFEVLQPGRAPFPTEAELALPADTAAGGWNYLERMGCTVGSTAVMAEGIRELVRASAVYDRSAEAMPGDSPDFALWFLEQADRGYCVHFATAAAVLLRSAGIPARYVTGFTADTLPGQTVWVTGEQAHAWVEYYDYSDSRWRILDATPPEPAAEAPLPRTAPPLASAGAAWAVWAVMALFALHLQRQLRLYFRSRRRRRGSLRDQVLYSWHESCTLAELLGSTPPVELAELAEKACYSRDGITAAELEPFRAYRRSICRRLRSGKRLRDWKYRYWDCFY